MPSFPKTYATEAMWKAFARDAKLEGADYVVFAFGDTRQMATELVALVVNGTKAATASLQRDFTDVGARSVSWGFLGGPRWAGYAAMRLRTTEVAVKPLLRSMFASLGTRLKGIALANGGSTPIDGTLEGKRCGGA